MGFLSSCGCVNTTVWMHHMDANKTYEEKARWELHKNANCCLGTNPGSSTPQNRSCTATYLPFYKPPK